MKSNFETISFLWVISVSLTSPFLQVSASKSFWSLWSKPCEERWKSRANSQADNDPWNGHWKVIQPASIFSGAVSPGHEDCNNSKVVGYLTDGEAHSATENFAPRIADSKWFGKQDDHLWITETLLLKELGTWWNVLQRHTPGRWSNKAFYLEDHPS